MEIPETKHKTQFTNVWVLINEISFEPRMETITSIFMIFTVMLVQVFLSLQLKQRNRTAKIIDIEIVIPMFVLTLFVVSFKYGTRLAKSDIVRVA